MHGKSNPTRSGYKAPSIQDFISTGTARAVILSSHQIANYSAYKHRLNFPDDKTALPAQTRYD